MATTKILGKEITAFSASYATTASFALSAAAFPYTGSARITGSLGVTGSFNQGSASLATGLFAHAQGYLTTASGDYSHAEGNGSKAMYFGTHAEGYTTEASGAYSHAEGAFTSASGDYSHAEGNGSKANQTYSHAEGYFTLASGLASHAEGYYTVNTANYSHAEGAFTLAEGESSHTEGRFTTASGDYSHAEGLGTVANGFYQHVQGQYNLSSSAQSAFIVGNGTGVGALRSNLIFASGSRVQVTGSVIATAGFTGSLQGTASIATTAASASSILAASGPAGTYSIPWMSQKTAGIATYFQGDTILQYTTSTGQLSATSLNATSITGSHLGNTVGTASYAVTAATASKVTTGLVSTNATHYIPFVGTNHGTSGVNFLGTMGGFSCNPSAQRMEITGSLFATSITGSLQGTASYATRASQSGYTMQFVLATTGSNPAASTTYILGAPVRNQLNTVSGATRIYVPRPGKVRYAHLYIKTYTTASVGTSTFRLQKTDISAITLTETIANSTFAARNTDASVVSTELSMSVVQGDFLEITWVTPAWGTLPKAVEANAIIYIENNI